MKAKLIRECEALNPLRGRKGQPAKTKLAPGTVIDNADAWRLCVIQPGNQPPCAEPMDKACKEATAKGNQRHKANLQNMATVMSSLTAKLKKDKDGNLVPTSDAEAQFIATAVAYGLHEMQPAKSKK